MAMRRERTETFMVTEWRMLDWCSRERASLIDKPYLGLQMYLAYGVLGYSTLLVLFLN